MKVAVYHNNNHIEIEDRPIPAISDNEMLVRTKSCGVCVADTMEWYLSPRAPLTLGHEPTGVVEKIGKKCTNFQIGDRVFVHHHVPCLACVHCRNRNFTMCETFKKTHIHPGGFSEYFVASAEHTKIDTLLLPDHVSFSEGTLIEPLGCVIHAIQKAGIRAGDSVVLIGTGTMGLMFIQALLFWGVRELVVYEILDWRIKKAKQFGAETVLKPLQDPDEESKRLKDVFQSDGADKVIVAAKDIKAMELGLKLANKGGTVLFFATPHPEESVKIFPSYIFFNEISITSSYSANHLDTRMALQLIANGDVNAKRIISHHYEIENLSDAILQTASRHESLKCVVDF